MLGFHQSWLYFGLMAAFFRKPISTADFVETSCRDGSKVLQSRMLLRLIDARALWRRIKGAGVHVVSEYRCLRIAVNHYLHLDQPHIITARQDEPELEIFLSKILFSIRILITTLMSTTDMPYISFLNTQMRPWSDQLGREPPSAKMLASHMIHSG